VEKAFSFNLSRERRRAIGRRGSKGEAPASALSGAWINSEGESTLLGEGVVPRARKGGESRAAAQQGRPILSKKKNTYLPARTGSKLE